MTRTRSSDVAPVDAAEMVVILFTAGLVFVLYAGVFFASGTAVPFGLGWAGPLLAIAGIVSLGAAATIRGVTGRPVTKPTP